MVGDIAETALIRSIIRRHHIDAIIHFAGSIVVPESIADPLGYYDNNTCKTRTLLEAAVAGKVAHFIFSSTAAVYGSAGMQAVREDHPLMPQSPYGVSKLMSEWMLRDASAAHGFQLHRAALFQCRRRRSAWPHRPVDAGRHASVEGRLRDRARQAAVHGGLRHRLSDTGRHRHSRLHPRHRPCRGASAGAGHGCAPAAATSSPIAATATASSVLELIDSVKRVHGAEFEVRMAPRRPGDPAAVIADSALARRELAWQPHHDDLDTIVSNALSWERILAAKNSKAATPL